MNLLNIDERKALIERIDSGANVERKKKSKYQYDVFKNKLKDHVKNHLKSYLSETSIKQMSLIHSVGMCERIVKQEASIYKEAPKRTFSELNEDQLLKIANIYSEMNYDEKGKIHNRFYKLQHQSLSMIIPKKGKLVKKVLLEHQYDIIENPEDPEEPLGYVLSNMNQPDETENRRYVVWSKEFNFTMNGDGVILTEKDQIENPIAPLLPMTLAAAEKNGEYYLDEEETSVDFTVLLNAALSELYHIMRMQGFGQAVITGTKQSMPEATELEIGVNSIIALLTEEGKGADFKFVNANPDLAGSIEVISTLLSAYLSSKGLDPRTVAIKGDAPQTFSSGWERFLALIEKFEATKDDLAVFKTVEEYEFDIIRAWHNVAIGSELLDKDLVTTTLPDTAKIKTEFVKPEAIMTEPERIDSIKKTEDNKYISHLEAIKQAHNLDTIQEAEEKYKKIQEEDSNFPGSRVVEEENDETEDDVDNGEDDTKLKGTDPASAKDKPDIIKDALNGAQVSSMVEVVSSVASGTLPRSSGVKIIQMAFQLSVEEAEDIIGDAGRGFKPKTEEVVEVE